MAYDGFEDGTLDAWTEQTTTGGTIQVLAAAKKNGNLGCRMTTDGANDAAAARIGIVGLNINIANLYCWMRISDATNWFQWVNDATDWFGIGYFLVHDDKFYYAASAGATQMATVPQNNTWYRLRITFNQTTRKVSFRIYNANNTLLEEALDKDTFSAQNLGAISYEFDDKLAASTTGDLDDCCQSDTTEPAIAGQFLTGNKYR